jgi:hypothetical protein
MMLSPHFSSSSDNVFKNNLSADNRCVELKSKSVQIMEQKEQLFHLCDSLPDDYQR